MHNSEDAPRKESGRKVGYMQILHNYFLEKFPDLGFLTPQNLRDKVNHAKLVNRNQSTLQDTYNSQVNLLLGGNQAVEDITSDVVNVQQVNGDYALCPLNRLECDAFDKAKELLSTIRSNVGNMIKREWTTRVKVIPTANDVNSINKIISRLKSEINIEDQITGKNYFDALWNLDCVIYAAVISWNLVNNVKCQINKNKGSVNKTLPKWIKDLDKQVQEKRKLISQCVAEVDRLKRNGRMTRKTRRNRKLFESKMGTISIYSLTKFIMKLKAETRKLTKSRKRKIKNHEAREYNRKFQNSQSHIYNEFKNIIEKHDGEELPVFKKMERTRKHFESKEEVENFWRSLWEREDEGNPEVEWLREYEALFENVIPEIDQNNIEINSDLIWKAIKKKRNWSAPGPDGIVNFWLKKLCAIHEDVERIFKGIINEDVEIKYWYTEGRTALLEKPGEWVANNTRPITCTNNLYKWLSSVIQIIFKSHAGKYNLMQMDQRGAKENCSGTFQNILIDSMVLNDAHDNQRNLYCGWVDVKKAYDSLSHKWIEKMLLIHRFPKKLSNIIMKIIDSWSVKVMIPLEGEDTVSERIKIKNGVLQGDIICADLYVLSKNPISWELNRFDGYVLSKPISEKITHSLYIDDLKTYDKNRRKQKQKMSHAKKIMKDAGLNWNIKKSKVLNIKRGSIDLSEGDLTLDDGSKLESLEDEDLYKFLGIPENTLHDVKRIVESLHDVVRKRCNVVWTSPLSDNNKIMATNTFILSSVEYYMWTQNITLTDIRKIDEIIREALNNTNAKYKLQMNSALYLPRNKGGRGLRNLESTYKCTKIKAAIKVLTDVDPRMKLVKRFDVIRMEKKRKSLINDAMRYAKEDFNAKLEIDDNTINFMYMKGDDEVITSDYSEIGRYLKEQQVKVNEENCMKSTWQGVMLTERWCDPMVDTSECFAWNHKWKTCPVEVINDIHSIYLQIVPTLAFKKFRGDKSINSTNCRLCNADEAESVRHLLSHCEKFAKTLYKRRHDKILQYILFNFLVKEKLIENCPPWYSKIEIKKYYRSDELEVFWDIPEYSGNEEEDEEKTLRPDGKIILMNDKTIYVLEQSVPWTTNREVKFEDKEEKYRNIIRNLKLDYPGYSVHQLTFIIDCLGGYSNSLKESISKLGFAKKEVDNILFALQKIAVSEARMLINHFKLLTNL